MAQWREEHTLQLICWKVPERTHGGAVHEEGKDPGWRILRRSISHERDLILEWKGLRSPPLEEEDVAETDDQLIDDVMMITVMN